MKKGKEFLIFRSINTKNQAVDAMHLIAIGLLLLSSLQAAAPGDTASVRSECSFDLDSLETQPLPKIEGLSFGNTTLDLRTDAATFDSNSRTVHIIGRVIIRQDQEGVTSCTIALGSLKLQREILKFSPRFQILTDHEGRFSLDVRIACGDVLLLTWTGEIYRMYRIGNLIR